MKSEYEIIPNGLIDICNIDSKTNTVVDILGQVWKDVCIDKKQFMKALDNGLPPGSLANVRIKGRRAHHITDHKNEWLTERQGIAVVMDKLKCSHQRAEAILEQFRKECPKSFKTRITP